MLPAISLFSCFTLDKDKIATWLSTISNTQQQLYSVHTKGNLQGHITFVKFVSTFYWSVTAVGRNRKRSSMRSSSISTSRQTSTEAEQMLLSVVSGKPRRRKMSFLPGIDTRICQSQTKICHESLNT